MCENGLCISPCLSICGALKCTIHSITDDMVDVDCINVHATTEESVGKISVVPSVSINPVSTPIITTFRPIKTTTKRPRPLQTVATIGISKSTIEILTTTPGSNLPKNIDTTIQIDTTTATRSNWPTAKAPVTSIKAQTSRKPPSGNWPYRTTSSSIQPTENWPSSEKPSVDHKLTSLSPTTDRSFTTPDILSFFTSSSSSKKPLILDRPTTQRPSTRYPLPDRTTTSPIQPGDNWPTTKKPIIDDRSTPKQATYPSIVTPDINSLFTTSGPVDKPTINSKSTTRKPPLTGTPSTTDFTTESPIQPGDNWPSTKKPLVTDRYTPSRTSSIVSQLTTENPSVHLVSTTPKPIVNNRPTTSPILSTDEEHSTIRPPTDNWPSSTKLPPLDNWPTSKNNLILKLSSTTKAPALPEISYTSKSPIEFWLTSIVTSIQAEIQTSPVPPTVTPDIITYFTTSPAPISSTTTVKPTLYDFECTSSLECSRQEACIDNDCADPCQLISCDSGFVCVVSNHIALCQCPTGSSIGSLCPRGNLLHSVSISFDAF